MTADPLRWLELEEEASRPIQTAKRIELTICWREWPGGRWQRKSVLSHTREELDYVARSVLAELQRRPDGAVILARLVARYDPVRERAG